MHHNICKIVFIGLFLLSAKSVFPDVIHSKVPIKTTLVVDNPRVSAACLISNKFNPELKKQLEKISIGVIDRPLGELKLSKKELEEKLGEFSKFFDIPRRVQILRKGELIQGKSVAKKVIDICLSEYQDSSEIEVDVSRIPEHFVVPSSVVSWQVYPISTNVLGMRLFALEAELSEGKFRQILQVEVYRPFVAAKVVKLVKRGERFSELNVKPEKMRIKNEAPNNIMRFEDVIGRLAASIKSPGTYIRTQDLVAGETFPITGTSSKNSSTKCNKTDWIVRPGDKVEFLVKSGNLSLSVPAKALEGGCLGDTIKLINLQNNKNIVGTIAGEGRVEYAAD